MDSAGYQQLIRYRAKESYASNEPRWSRYSKERFSDSWSRFQRKGHTSEAPAKRSANGFLRESSGLHYRIGSNSRSASLGSSARHFRPYSAPYSATVRQALPAVTEE